MRPSSEVLSRHADEAAALDARHPLLARRELFNLPEGVVYLDGNSLGPLPRAVSARLSDVVGREWGRDLIGSWNSADWMGLPRRCGDLIAPLVGATPGDIIVGESTSVALFKLLVAGSRLRPGRRVLLLEEGTFPTDRYVARGVADLLGLVLRECDPQDLDALALVLDEVGPDLAVASFTQVDFRTGELLDAGAITAAVRGAGGLMLWDLCHTAGAVPIDLTALDADLAVGCTYKYLNGGPGSPAFSWVAPRHQVDLDQPITGWIGHAAPFEMGPSYRPAEGVGRLASGTPPVLALSTLEAALGVFDGVEPSALRAASLSLTDFFIALLDEHVLGEQGASAGPNAEPNAGPNTEPNAGAAEGTAEGPGVDAAAAEGRARLATPRDHARRGSQVSLRHRAAYGLVQALIARGVVGDFREPDIARFGFAPMYLSHADVLLAVAHLVAVLEAGEHLHPQWESKNPVT